MLGMINLSRKCFNTLVAIERSYLSVCQQHVRVQISDSSASVDALVEFVRLLLCVHQVKNLHGSKMLAPRFKDEIFTVADKKNVAFFTSQEKIFGLNQSI